MAIESRHLLGNQGSNRGVPEVFVAQLLAAAAQEASRLLPVHRRAGEEEVQRLPRLVEDDVRPDRSVLGPWRRHGGRLHFGDADWGQLQEPAEYAFRAD